MTKNESLMSFCVTLSFLFMLSCPAHAMGKKPPAKKAVASSPAAAQASQKETANLPQAPVAGAEHAQEALTAKKPRPLPVYVCELPNINDYNIFANGGWDGSWYVGFNVCWIEKLAPIPPGEYTKAFIGAKLGRMKTQHIAGRPLWEKEPVPGEIYMAIASSPAWKSSQSYYLTGTADIPLEPDWENALEGVGEARWFWREVPLRAVTLSGTNYLALWSPTRYFVSIASSPVLAGGWGSKKENSWMNNEIKGYAPLDPQTSLKTSISVFEPAIALKLIPAGAEQNIRVTIDAVTEGREKTTHRTFKVSITGDQIEKAWLEVYDTKDKRWEKYGRFVYTPPYLFTVKPADFSGSSIFIRCAANDVWGNISASEHLEFAVQK